MEHGPKKYTERWFGYFDLLGFSQLVLHKQIDQILPIYDRALDAIEEKVGAKKAVGLSYTWFSDTFIIYTRGGTEKEFTYFEQACRLFYHKLIAAEIPVRGSLTYGPVYTNRKKHTYIGEGLIDAYNYGESQDWIGFVLTPKIFERLKKTTIPVDKLINYSPVPKNILHASKVDAENVYAFNHNVGTLNGENVFAQPLRNMKSRAKGKNKKKYTRTEKFMEKHRRRVDP